MGTGSKDTFFQSGGGAGQGASDYLKDAFQDVSVPANTNTGFTSSASTNPFSQSFLNDDNPKYSLKTLFVTDLVLLDRSLWISNKPTYQIIFHETFPGVFGYCFGNVRLRNFKNGKCVELREIDDGIGVTSVARRLFWGINPVTDAAANADVITDGVDTAADITFSGLTNDADNQGLNKQNWTVHQASNATKDIHDYRLTANQPRLLTVFGVAAYYENASTNIDLFPGSTYVDKDKKTTNSLTTQSLAAIAGRLGGRTLLYKTSFNTYATSTVEPINVSTTGTGAGAGSTIDLATGSGASFPVGSGIATISSGSSYQVFSVVSVSTDTVTVNPALTFGVTGTIYKLWQSGSTYAINASLYVKSFEFDPSVSSVDSAVTTGFAQQQNGDLYWSDQNKRYRVWGDQLKTTFADGYYGVAFNGATVGFLQVDAMASAMEIEFAGGVSGVIHGTFSVNGCVSYGLNEALVGNAKKTVFTGAGPGWNNFYFSVGASFSDVVVNKVNFYTLQKNVGITLGNLSQYANTVDAVPRLALNATLAQMGAYRRVYADDLYFGATWTRGTTHTAAGGVYYQSIAAAGPNLTFEYFGKDFAVLGTAGGSLNITLDGASISSSLNAMKSVATEGFHKLILTHQSASTVIHAIDYTRSHGEVKSLQNFLPRQELDDAIQINQGNETPRNPKPGDIWGQSKDSGIVWVYLWDRWNQFKINAASDDPNIGYVLTYGGLA